MKIASAILIALALVIALAWWLIPRHWSHEPTPSTIELDTAPVLTAPQAPQEIEISWQKEMGRIGEQVATNRLNQYGGVQFSGDKYLHIVPADKAYHYNTHVLVSEINTHIESAAKSLQSLQTVDYQPASLLNEGVLHPAYISVPADLPNLREDYTWEPMRLKGDASIKTGNAAIFKIDNTHFTEILDRWSSVIGTERLSAISVAADFEFWNRNDELGMLASLPNLAEKPMLQDYPEAISSSLSKLAANSMLQGYHEAISSSLIPHPWNFMQVRHDSIAPLVNPYIPTSVSPADKESSRSQSLWVDTSAYQSFLKLASVDIEQPMVSIPSSIALDLMRLDAVREAIRLGQKNPSAPAVWEELFWFIIQHPYTPQAEATFTAIIDNARGNTIQRQIKLVESWAEARLPEPSRAVFDLHMVGYLLDLQWYRAVLLRSDEALARDQKHPFADHLLLMRVNSYAHLGQINQALADADMILQQYSQSAVAPEAGFLKAWVLFDTGRPAAGYQVLQQIVQQYPQAPIIRDAQKIMVKYEEMR